MSRALRVWTQYVAPPLVSGNNMIRHTARGRYVVHYPSPEYKAFQERIVPLFAATAPDPPIIHHELHLAVPTDRRRDLDNLVKPIADCLEAAGVILADNWADEHHIIRDPFIGGGVEVTVIERPGDPETCSRCRLNRPHTKPAKRGRKPKGEK